MGRDKAVFDSLTAGKATELSSRRGILQSFGEQTHNQDCVAGLQAPCLLPLPAASVEPHGPEECSWRTAMEGVPQGILGSMRILELRQAAP